MRTVIKGKTCIIQDERGQEIFSITKRGAGRYLISPPKGKGLQFEGDVVNAKGWMSYEPGFNIGICTSDGVAVKVGIPEDLSHTQVTAK